MEAASRWVASARSRSVSISMVVRLRWRPVVTASSNAAAMPLSPRLRIVSIISCRCIIASQQIVAGTVGERRMPQHPVFRSDDAVGCRRLAAPGEDVEDQLVAGRSVRSEEHTSELQSLMRISYAVFCLEKKITHISNP